MKRYLIILVITYSSFLVSFPINYQRFILTDKSGRSIKKVIDMFGDNHIKLYHPKAGFNPSDASNINYTQVERTLNDVLTKLELFADKHPLITRRGEKQQIDLVWEMAAEQTGNSSSVFMHAIGAKLAQEFSPNKNKFIRFIFADEYRGIDMALFAFVYGHHDRTVSVSTTYDNYPVATAKNFDKSVERLLQLPGISVDIPISIGTPLTMAVGNYLKYAEGNDDVNKAKAKHIIDLLINKKANVNLADVDGNTPLLVAAALDNLELVQFLLEHGANPNIVNLVGETPIEVTDSQDVAGLLVRYGAKEVAPKVEIVEEIPRETLQEMPPLVD